MRSPLGPIFLVVLVDVLGLTIVIPLLALYAERFGASPLVASLLVPTYAVCQLVAGPILGSLSDRHGRKRLLVISQLGTLAGFVLLANANALWMVFAGRALDGITAGNLTIAQAYIADRTAPEKRASAFAIIGIAFGLGFLVGPAIGGIASREISPSAPFYIAAGLSALSILASIFVLPKEEASTRRTFDAKLKIISWGQYARFFAQAPMRGLLLQFFVFMLAFNFFFGGFALFAERTYVWDGHPFGEREIGVTFALSGFIGAFVQGGMIKRLVPRFGEGKLIAFAFASFAVGFVLLGASPTLTMLGAAIVASAIGHSLLRPNLTALVTRWADPRDQGAVLGLTQSLAALGSIIAPPIAGWLITHDQLSVWTWVAGATAALGLLLAPLGSAHGAPPSKAPNGVDL